VASSGRQACWADASSCAGLLGDWLARLRASVQWVVPLVTCLMLASSSGRDGLAEVAGVLV
jgi:hypothetical protein